MKREIKFRGKRIDNGEWVYGGYFSQDYGEEGRKHLIVNDSQGYEIDPKTVGQFTGGKNRKKIEIFEGDIVEYCDAVCEIKIIPKMGQICAYPIKGGNFTSGWGWLKMKVIGNIHDNPELLEEKS